METTKIYNAARTMTQKQVQQHVKAMNSSQRKIYDVLVRLGDSKQLACATIIATKK